MKKLFLISIVAAGAMFAACEKSGNETEKNGEEKVIATAIEIVAQDGTAIADNKVTVLEAGLTLGYKLSPEGAVLPEGATITWTSSATAKITSTPATDGKTTVLAHAEGVVGGETSQITVSFGDVTSTAITATAFIPVYATGIVLVNGDGTDIVDNKVTVKWGENLELGYKLLPEGANSLPVIEGQPAQSVVFTSSRPADVKMEMVDGKVVLSLPEDTAGAFEFGSINEPKNDPVVLTASFMDMDGETEIKSTEIKAVSSWDVATEIKGVALTATCTAGETFSLDLSNIEVVLPSTVPATWNGVKFGAKSGGRGPGAIWAVNGTDNSFTSNATATGTWDVYVFATNNPKTPMDDAYDGEGGGAALTITVTINPPASK
jgi:hypothetical protein